MEYDAGRRRRCSRDAALRRAIMRRAPASASQARVGVPRPRAARPNAVRRLRRPRHRDFAAEVGGAAPRNASCMGRDDTTRPRSRRSTITKPGAVVPAPGATPLDHTSIPKLVESRWGLPALTARDAAAPDPGTAFSVARPRTDGPLAGVAVPQAKGRRRSGSRPSHSQEGYADLISRPPVADAVTRTRRRARKPVTTDDCERCIRDRIAAWKASRNAR